MRKPSRLIAALAASSILASNLIAVPALAQRTEVGTTSVVAGDVEFTAAQQRNARQLRLRDRIAWGDLIATSDRAQAQILLLDRSTFGIGARTRMRIDEYVYNPNEGRSLVATVLRGAVRFFSGEQAGSNSASINAPAARIGIRGTALDVLAGEEARSIARNEPAVGRGGINENEATLVVLRGPGVQTAGGLTVGSADVTSGGVTVVLDQPGQAAFVPRVGAAPIMFRISNAGLSSLQEQLAPRVANPGGGGNGGLIAAIIGTIVGAVVLSELLDNNDNAGTTIDTGNCNRGYYRDNSGQCVLENPQQPPTANSPAPPPVIYSEPPRPPAETPLPPRTAETPPDSQPNSPIG